MQINASVHEFTVVGITLCGCVNLRSASRFSIVWPDMTNLDFVGILQSLSFVRVVGSVATS